MESISEKFIYDRRYWLVTGRDTGQDLSGVVYEGDREIG